MRASPPRGLSTPPAKLGIYSCSSRTAASSRAHVLPRPGSLTPDLCHSAALAHSGLGGAPGTYRPTWSLTRSGPGSWRTGTAPAAPRARDGLGSGVQAAPAPAELRPVGPQALGPPVTVPLSLELLRGPRLGLGGDMQRLRLDRRGSGQPREACCCEQGSVQEAAWALAGFAQWLECRSVD